MGTDTADGGAPLLERLMLWGFCAAAFFTPASLSVSTVFALFSIVLWVFSGRIFKDARFIAGQEWFLPVLVFMLLPWVGLTYTDDVSAGLREAKKSYYWFYAFAASTLAMRGLSPKSVSISFLAGLSITAVIYILQFRHIIPFYEEYYLGFINYITYSLMLVFGLLLLSFYFGKSGWKMRAIICLLMALYFTNLVIIPGRAGYLAFLLLSPLIVFRMTGGRHIFIVAAAAVLLASALFISPLVRTRVSQVASDITEYRKGNAMTSGGERLHMWTGAAKIFLERPFTGVGTGGYKLAMKDYEIPSVAGKEYAHPHNSFLYMAASYGILGLISIIWLCAVLLSVGWRGREGLAGFASLSITLVIMIGSLTGTQILQGQSAMLLALFTGFASDEKKIGRKGLI